MKYYSTSDRNYKVDLETAVTRSLAPGKGLYMPESIPALPYSFLEQLYASNFPELSAQLARQFFGDDLEQGILDRLVKDAINFPTPLIEVEKGIYSLELFHGPTLAFKDVGVGSERPEALIDNPFLVTDLANLFVIACLMMETVL